MAETAQATQAAQADQEDQVDQMAERVQTDQPDQPAQEASAVRQITQRTPKGVSVGSCIRGINVQLHWSLFIVTLLTMLFSYRKDGLLMQIFLRFVVYGPILYVTVLGHEIGHAFMTLKLGGEVTRLVLWPAGGLTITGLDNGTAKDDLKIALAGPLMHIPMLVFWFLVLWLCYLVNDDYILTSDLSSPVLYLGNLAYLAFSLNVYIILVNLCIPIYPFDSGRIIGSAVIAAGMKVEGAAKLTAIFGIAVGFTISILGLVWFGFFDAIAEILIGLLIIGSSVSLFFQAKNGTLSKDVIFGRQCYSQGNNVDSEGDGSEVSVPESSSPIPVGNEIV